MITEATGVVTELTGFFRAAADLSKALADVAGPWITAAVGAVATWYARRALVASKEGNKVAEKTLETATIAADAAVVMRQEVNDHNATITMAAHKGLEREKFEQAIEIGMQKERAKGNTGPAPMGK